MLRGERPMALDPQVKRVFALIREAGNPEYCQMTPNRRATGTSAGQAFWTSSPNL
jgi:hypothetical protein